MGDMGWKIASAGAMGLSALVAGKVVEGGWKLVTGHDVPHEDDDEVALAPLLAFAALSAVAVALAQRFTMKRAKRFVASSHRIDA